MCLYVDSATEKYTVATPRKCIDWLIDWLAKLHKHL